MKNIFFIISFLVFAALSHSLAKKDGSSQSASQNYSEALLFIAKL